MALTYHPFEEAPQVEELVHDLEAPVAAIEKAWSGRSQLPGLGLITFSLSRKGLLRWVLLIAGCFMLVSSFRKGKA